jgi:penicillin-binding protein 2
MSDNSRVRVSIVGVVIVALFSALLARLWFLQVGSGEDLQVQAISRTTRVVQSDSPRGRILDRNGVELVVNRASWVLTVGRDLDDETRTLVLGQLAELLGPPYTREQLEQNYDDVRQSPLQPAIVAVDVPEPVRVAVLEHIEDFPGTRVDKITVRDYPRGALAAHVLGYVGEISADQLEELGDDGYRPGDAIGRAGVERAYERDLRGPPRRETVEVDPRGRVVGKPIEVERGSVGNDVYLTIDANWQQAAEESLLQGIEEARSLQNENVRATGYETLKAPAGAVVALDVTDGSVVAMASYPSYDPALFVDGISQVEWTDLNENPEWHQPLVNRATQGQYAPGSTFKLVSSIAATRYGVRSHDEWIEDDGVVHLRDRDWRNAGSVALGDVDLQRAITRSSDVYFYTIGDEFWQIWKDGDTERGLGLQTTARELGFGAPTGIELDETRGLVPDPDWKRETAYRIWDTEQQRQENAIWYPADDILMAIGQGMAVTPLQLANAYAAFANGGTLWQPKLASEVRDADDRVVRSVEPRPLRTVAIDPVVRARMHAGFVGAVQDERGTAYGAFAGFPFDVVSVAGKTGTAQVKDKGDTSLFAAYFPADAPRYVVVAVVEEGGRGAQVAAPIVRRVVEAMSGLEARPVEANDEGRD